MLMILIFLLLDLKEKKKFLEVKFKLVKILNVLNKKMFIFNCFLDVF